MHLRHFTPEEDAVLVAQANGDLKITVLGMQKMMGISRDVLERRAANLGVKLITRGHRNMYKPSNERTHALPYHDNGSCNISTGEPDKLLARLQDEHGERRYEAMDLTIAKRISIPA